MTAADEAHDRLLEGMVDRTPECRDLDLFTADVITKADAAVMKPICDGCELIILCRRYAEADRPALGFWAGVNYSPIRTRRPEAA